MNLPEGFSFLNEKKDFPIFINKGKRSKNLNEIYSYDSKNANRTNILLFGDVFDKRTIYKYIDRRKFIEYVKKQNDDHLQGFSLCFQQPSEWTDPYESRFYNADYSILKNMDFLEGHRKLYACCFAEDKESEPSWKMYVDEKNDDDRKVCIQLKINFKALLDYLNHYIKNELGGDYMLLVGRVTYMEKPMINKLHRPINGKLNGNYFDNFNFTKYLRLLMLKRKAYHYEDEIRFFLIPRNGVEMKKRIIIPIPTKGDVSKTINAEKIIDKIFLDPYSNDDEVDSYFQKLSGLNFCIPKEKFDISDLNESFSIIKIGEDKETEQKRKEKEAQDALEALRKKYNRKIKASL